MERKFTYTDEEDKGYGLAGMLISLNVLDDDFKVISVSLDSPDGDSIVFSPDFYFTSNPRLSARIAWNEMLKQYQLMTGMVISNLLCRQFVHCHKPLDKDMLDYMRAIIDEDGREVCQLETDEIDVLFRKTFHCMRDVFENSKVHILADRFVLTLRQRRTLSGSEILDALR